MPRAPAGQVIGPFPPKNLIVVTTCARPKGASYLHRTLTAVDREGGNEIYPHHKFVFCDGELGPLADQIPAGWSVVINPGPPQGPRRNMWGAFRLAHKLKAERLLYFEDDLEFCKNAIRYMSKLEVPQSMAMISFHDWKEFQPGAPPGMYRLRFPGRDGRGFFGAQALMIPQGTIGYLVKCDPLALWTSDTSKFSDRTLEVYLYMSSWQFYVSHLPCLVRHVGQVSAAHPGKPLDGRHTSNFPGPEFDALSLKIWEALDVPKNLP